MSGYAMKTNSAWVTSKKALKKTPPSEEYKERVHYMRSHDFSLIQDPHTGEFIVKATEKRQE